MVDFELGVEDTSAVDCLVISVGGSPEPIVYSIEVHKPIYVVYVASIASRLSVQNIVMPRLKHRARDSEVLTLSDEQDLVSCVREIIVGMNRVFKMWAIHGRNVVCDFTGGTKVMSAAMVLSLTSFKSTFSYVGGSVRGKSGLGVVESGNEMLLHLGNPWDFLAIPDLTDIALFFNSYQFKAAKDSARGACLRLSAQKPFFEMLEVVSDGYDSWDSFQYGIARGKLRRAESQIKNIAVLAGCSSVQSFLRVLSSNIAFLESVENDVKPYVASVPAAKVSSKYLTSGADFLHDLLANANRRAETGRYDDAVSRLYSAFEKMAKACLISQYGIDNSNVDIVLVPESERVELESRRDPDGKIRIGLERSFILLRSFDSDLGHKYFEKSKELSSVLQRRNQSLLAHGFRPVDAKDFQLMMEIALEFLGIQAEDLPVFPRMDWQDVIL